MGRERTVPIELKIKGLEKLDHKQREIAHGLITKLHAELESNPLHRFNPHPKQHTFLAADTPIVAAFAGNRFGKTASLVISALCQCLDEKMLPIHLRVYKRREAPSYGRLVVPDVAAALYGVLLPSLRDWCPREALIGGSFDASWDKQRRILHFANGSWIQCMTYEMDLDKFGGAALDFIGYDEWPPEDIRDECRARLIDRAGYEMFALTPLKGIGWVYREVWKKREHPTITVIQGAMHDNPHIDQEAKERYLDRWAPDDPERRSREYGEFAHFGGMVYPGGFDHRLVDPPKPDQLGDRDVVVGIDPGLRAAAFVWVVFDQDNNALVFDEVLLEQRTPVDYARAIRQTNLKWGIPTPAYVIDPSARNRTLTNAESVQTELSRQGIQTIWGQNAVEAGVQQIRRRLQQGSLHVASHCRGLRDEAEEYRMEDEEDFKVVKEHDHRLDALRYVLMLRPWYPNYEGAMSRLGWVPGAAPPQEWFDAHPPVQPSTPMGPMS